MSSLESEFHLALREVHANAGAAFARRHGWVIPAHYGDAAAEYSALRGSAAIVDRSSRSRVMVTGTDAAELLAATFAGHILEIDEGRALRTVRLHERGHIRDLVLIARTGGIAYLVAGEPSQRIETIELLKSLRGSDWDVRVEDRTETTCMLAVSGPAAAGVVEQHLSDALPARLPNLGCVGFEFHGFRALAIRASDTGDDGFEFMVAPAVAQHMIETLDGAGLKLAGDDAQEVARIEACIPAFEPDLEPGLSPAAADIDVLLDVPGGDDSMMLSAVLLETDSPPPVATAVAMDGNPAGQLRSCAWSPGLRATIGLALIEAKRAIPGAALDAGGIPGTIVAKPFYRRRA